MFCSSCGNPLASDTRFCSKCGSTVLQGDAPGSVPYGTHHAFSQLIGYSPRISDPSFDRYRKASNRWSYIFTSILAVIAIIGFPIYGKSSGEIEWPNSLYYGIGIGAMFIVIAFFQNLKRSRDKTWDGVVTDINSYKRRDQDDDSSVSITHTYYNLVIRKDNGGQARHSFRDLPGVCSYYHIGERVRHHKGFLYYEKYDKSRDSQILCVACNTMNPVQEEYCGRCKCPLLK